MSSWPEISWGEENWGHPPVAFVVSAFLSMLCVPTCVLRTRGGHQWVSDELASACGAIGVCVCEARQRDLCDCVVVIRRRCGQALTLNVVILQATSVLLPSLSAENLNDTDAHPSRMLLTGRLPVIALPVSFRQNDPVPGQ